MPWREAKTLSIREHIAHMDDIRVVREEVDPQLGVTPYLLEDQTRPVMFENIAGARLIGNLWSTRDRIAHALNTSREEMIHRIAEAHASPKEPRLMEGAEVLSNSTDDVDLTTLPIPKFYSGDGGPYITGGVLVGEWEGARNVSFHRLMVSGKRSAVARLVPRHLFAMHESAKSGGKDLPIAVVIGACPPVLIAAASSLAYGDDELNLASGLRTLAWNEPVEVVKLPGSGLVVPAIAEYILEGRITTRTAPEGPFVDITGTVDVVREQPIVEIDRMYHMDEPIFHTILPGGFEHYMMMGLPKEPVIYKAVSAVVPRVRAVRLTEGGCSWLHGVVSIRKQKQGDGKNAILAALASHASMKRVVVVDEDIDPFDDHAVEWALATRFQAGRDMVVLEGTRGSSLDPSADGTTAKMGMDATMPMGADRAKFELVK
jgi:UbiD family decarboxylase